MTPFPDLGNDELPPVPAPAAGDRAIALFRSRADLRKAHAELRDDLDRLGERLRHLEATSQRVRAQLATLDAGPQAPAPAVLLWHQLRALERVGRSLVAACVADASRECDERERSAHAADCNQRRFAARREAQAALRVEEGRFYDVRERLDALWHERLRYAAPWRFFRRRDVDRRILAAEREAAAIEAALAVQRELVERLDAEPATAFPGLSIGARRELNLLAIAAAEDLSRRLADTPLVRLASRAAHEQRPGDTGSAAECEALIHEIGRARARLHGTGLSAAALEARIAILRRSVRYGGEADTAPVPESIPHVASPAGDGADPVRGQGHAQVHGTGSEQSNVLLNDAWGLSGLLLR